MAITLVKATGTGLATANCYADLTDLESAAELLGEDISAYTDEQKKAALYVAANKYIDRLHEFKGEPIDSNQSMKLYTDLVTFDDASTDIIAANVEAAILQLKGYLFVDASEQSAHGDVISVMTKLDTLEKQTDYDSGTRIRSKYNTSTIDALLSKYLAPGTGGVALRLV